MVISNSKYDHERHGAGKNRGYMSEFSVDEFFEQMTEPTTVHQKMQQHIDVPRYEEVQYFRLTGTEE